jgi:hypothetical protein
MRKLIIILLMAISIVGNCQGNYPITITPNRLTTPDNSVKKPYNFIVLYRVYEHGFMQSGDSYTMEEKWNNKFSGFYTKEEMIKWFNSGNSWNEEQNTARLSEDEFIKAYDLVDMIEIKLEFKKEHKVKEKQVIVEKDEWDDTYWEVK